MPPKFWVETLSKAVYLINGLSSPNLQFDSPYSRFFGVAPKYNYLHVIGCVCFAHLPSIENHKLTAQSTRCAFLGYNNTQKAFICYDPNANKLHVSRNVVFFKTQYFFESYVDFPSTYIQLPEFDDLSYTIERFKPGLVY